MIASAIRLSGSLVLSDSLIMFLCLNSHLHGMSEYIHKFVQYILHACYVVFKLYVLYLSGLHKVPIDNISMVCMYSETRVKNHIIQRPLALRNVPKVCA